MASDTGHTSSNRPGSRRPRNRWSLLVWGGAAVLLAIPAIAMRFTSEVDWGPEDFIVMGAMLALACGSYEFVARLSGNTAYRAGAAAAIVVSFLTVWVNLAVGMLGDEGNPANLLFGLVILVAVIGALLSGFRPMGMARAMEAAALGQGAMTLYALFGGYMEVVLHVGAFILPWLVSAQLFRKAAREQGPAEAQP